MKAVSFEAAFFMFLINEYPTGAVYNFLMEDGKRTTAEIIINIIMVIFTVIGVVLMLAVNPEGGNLQASGIENFKFYTVLTNVFCGFVSVIYLAFAIFKKDTDKVRGLKLAALCGVFITFAVVAFMFGPLYGFPNFYKGGNLFFHLLLPLAAVFEFILARWDWMPFRYAVFSAVPTLLYGVGYTLNIVINGIGGPWPDTNDFYAFLSWGWSGGIAIFIGITLLAFIVACIFRAINNRRARIKA